MREGSPSTTAMFVAAARGAAGIDPFADRLVPRGIAMAMRLGAFGLVAHLRVRTHAIDDVVRAGALRGVTQVVILGAGLDARGWRLDVLRDSTVYEIDHPATQAFKRRRLGDARTLAQDVVFVGVDFERDDLEERLAAAGHDAVRPTTWIWEGVTPYLTAGAFEGSLAIIGRRSAPGSALAMTYVTPDLVELPRVVHPFAHVAFHFLGEPLRGTMSVRDAAAALDRHGFRVEQDDLIPDLARRFGMRRARPSMTERLVVALA